MKLSHLKLVSLAPTALLAIASSMLTSNPCAAQSKGGNAGTYCAAGTVCPTTALGSIVTPSGQCIAWVYRSEQCTGTYTVGELPCSTQPGSCSATPCNCSGGTTPVEPPPPPDDAAPPTGVLKRFFNTTMADVLKTASSFHFQDTVVRLVSTDYVTLTTPAGPAIVRFELYENISTGERWGSGFKQSASHANTAGVDVYKRVETSTAYYIQLTGTSVGYICYLPDTITAVP